MKEDDAEQDANADKEPNINHLDIRRLWERRGGLAEESVEHK